MLVAVDSFTHEVVGAEIAHVDDQSVDHGGGIDEPAGSGAWACAPCAASSSASAAWVEGGIAVFSRDRRSVPRRLVSPAAGATISRIAALRRIRSSPRQV